MKNKPASKIICLFTAIIILISMIAVFPVSVSAASGSLGGTKTVRSGDTITVTLYISGPDAYGCQASFSYDSSVLTYRSYKQNIKWGSFKFDSGALSVVANDTNESSPVSSSTAVVSLTFKVANSLPVGTPVSVSVTGTVSVKEDGTFKSNSFSSTYSNTVATPLSSNALLSSLTVSNAEISPEFDKNIQNYTCSVPFEVESLDISAKAQETTSKVEITNNELAAGGTTDVTITVTAESGAVNTYIIKTERAQDPNYVFDDNNKLISLVVEGFSVSPQFSPEITDYIVWLPYETSSISVYAETASEKAVYTVSENISDLEVGNNLVTVTVTAENEEERVYQIIAVRAEEFISVEEDLSPVEEEPEEESKTSFPIWAYAAICIFCLAVGFACSFMIPRGK
ncbi:MAG: cadherin-like beta sandwich domain-containing protein [Acutalibacteraceae bacterium]